MSKNNDLKHLYTWMEKHAALSAVIASYNSVDMKKFEVDMPTDIDYRTLLGIQKNLQDNIKLINDEINRITDA